MKNIAEAIKSKSASQAEALSRIEHKENRRILVVDDEREITQSYLEILSPKTQGTGNVVPLRSSRNQNEATATSETEAPEFNVTVASNFEEALAHVKQAMKKKEPFAMGFFDVLLGEGPDGYDLVKQIHELDPNLYAVFVTAYNDRSVDSIQNFLGKDKTNRWDYLNKPFSHGEILQKARNFTSLWNLTEEKKLKDEQLSQAQRRLLESERLTSVAAVARGVSHEFGNLLMQIMGKADISLQSGTPEKMKAGLETILEATQRANDILEKFKDLSNPGESVKEKSEVFLHVILEEAVNLMEHKIKVGNVKVSRIRTDKVKVHANPTSLLQVIVNLTINAIHAMGESGQVDFTITDVGDSAELRIRDYGPGIKPDMIDRVLEPFFTTKGSQGTGLGLPICKEIVEVEHMGDFRIKNHGVKGLEVVIKLPKMPA